MLITNLGADGLSQLAIVHCESFSLQGQTSPRPEMLFPAYCNWPGWQSDKWLTFSQLDYLSCMALPTLSLHLEFCNRRRACCCQSAVASLSQSTSQSRILLSSDCNSNSCFIEIVSQTQAALLISKTPIEHVLSFCKEMG